MSIVTRSDAGLAGLEPATWDRLAGPHFYSTAAWLEFCAMHGGGEQGAAVSHAGGEAVAAIPFTELTAPPFPLYRWNALLDERGLPTLPADGLLVAPRQGYQTHFLVASGVEPTAAVADVVRELRAREDAACVAMYLTSEDVRVLQAAGCASPPVLLDADAWLELPDGGWEGWLASLPSKRRREIRREARQFGDAGYTVRHLPLADCHERLGGLAAATMAKYGASATAEDWLRLLRMHVDGMGAAAQVSLCLRGDDPLGFCLYYVWGDTLYLRWAGFDYERLAGAAEYFNLAFYSHVALAAEIGVCRIHAGVKAPAAKALRGAELRPLWLVDLTEDSVLARHRDAVRAHNRTAYERLLADPCTRAAVTAADGWLEGCR